MAACGKMPLLESCLLGYVRLWSQKLQSKKRSIKREGFGGRKIGREILKQDANNNIQVFFEFLFQIFYGLKNFFSKFISLSRLIRHYWVSAFHLTQEASPTPTQPDPRQPSQGTKRLHPTHPYTLLLLSRFSRVQLCEIPQTAAYQAPPSLGFSRQEHWSGLPFPSAMHESEKWKWSHSVVPDIETPWTAAYQAPPSMGFSRQEYWSGIPLPSPRILHIP